MNTHVIHLATIRSIAILKSRLATASIEDQISILEQINGLIGGKNISLLLTIAIRHFHLGDDEKAFAFLAMANRLGRKTHDGMRVSLFFSMALQHKDSAQICAELLENFPNDDWAKGMQRKLVARDFSSITLPAISKEWQ